MSDSRIGTGLLEVEPVMSRAVSTSYKPRQKRTPRRAANAGERRANVRYPIAAPVRYRVASEEAEESQEGFCVNISSGGILFRTRQHVPTGKIIELSVAWPAMLGGTVALQLAVRGKVVRSGGGQVAVKVWWHEFRTTAGRRGFCIGR